MSSCSRRTALGAVLLAALSLDASALHLPPGCGVEALRGGGNPFQQCFGLRMRNPFHKPQPLPPPPPPPRMRTFKDKYFKVWASLLFGPRSPGQEIGQGALPRNQVEVASAEGCGAPPVSCVASVFFCDTQYLKRRRERWGAFFHHPLVKTLFAV